MKKNQEGFGHVVVVAAIVVLVLIAIVSIRVATTHKNINQGSKDSAAVSQPKSVASTLPLVIKNWPVKIAAYNSSTQLAGDVYMNKEVLVNSHLGLEQIPLSDAGRSRTEKNSGKVFTLPTIDFLTRSGAPLLSVSDGYVLNVDHQLENGRDDYEMHVVPEKGEVHQWMVIYDHLTKPSVKVGDTVVSGQQIGETGPVGSGAPYSFIELQVNYNTDVGRKNTSPNEGRCPSSSIAPDRTKDMLNELKLITSEWETLRGDSTIYNETAWVAPGCLSAKVNV